MPEPRLTAQQKLDSLRAVLEMDRLMQFRAIVYGRLLRRMIDAFGLDVLDIAEDMRRENGRFSAETWIDAEDNERKYREDPGRLIREIHEHFDNYTGVWARTCTCFYNSMPDKRCHELLSVRCTYSEAFRSIGEERIGITWCCYDMGEITAYHPLFYQYMPRHLLKGDGFCQQFRALAASPEEQARMNSIESTGWRSWK